MCVQALLCFALVRFRSVFNLLRSAAVLAGSLFPSLPLERPNENLNNFLLLCLFFPLSSATAAAAELSQAYLFSLFSESLIADK